MKEVKFISAMLALSIFMVSGTLTATADGELKRTKIDPVVYTYTDENGNEEEIRQSELDAGHWNKDALGKTAPVVYESFPVIMNPFVDDYAEMSLEIIYLKTTGEYDHAYVTVTDMYNNKDVYTEDITNGTVYTNDLDMDSYYRVKITECFNGEEQNEYTRYISTAYEPAEMPEYVTDPTNDDTEDISIVDTANIVLATTIDDQGRENFDADIAAFTNIPANEWNAYKDTLDNDKLYKVVAGEGRNVKTGFISTYSWGDDLGIFTPGYTLHSTDVMGLDASVRSQNSITRDLFDPTMINDSVVLNAYEYDCYGDELFNNTNSYYKVFKYVIKNHESQGDEYNVRINASDGFSYLVWYKKSNSSTLVKNYNSSSTNTGNKNVSMLAYFDGDYLDVGDTMYFIIYSPNHKGLRGSFCLENADINDDVTGSAYAQYASGNSIAWANYDTMTSYADAQAEYLQTYYLTDEWDVDTFYINNTASSDSGYSIFFTNVGNTSPQTSMSMTLTLYYVDFTDDNHFILKRKSSTSARVGIEKVVNLYPDNSNTKYFLEVMSSFNGSGNQICSYDEYNFYTVFYPET